MQSLADSANVDIHTMVSKLLLVQMNIKASSSINKSCKNLII